jgi:DNA invertase Pin-like site-specific DNA recombinase
VGLCIGLANLYTTDHPEAGKRFTVGDVVTVTRIDRLARSTFDLFGIVKRHRRRQARFRSLAEL